MKKYIAFFVLLLSLGIVVLAFKRIVYSTSPSISLGLAGDVMLGRLVNEIINQKGYTYVWGNLLPILQAHDLVMVNLENVFTTYSKAVPKVFNYKSDPAHVAVLKAGNITIVNNANNHILDFGIPGLIDTLQALDGAGILHVGAGMNSAQAQHPVILQRNGITIGILGATDNEPTWQAGVDKPGIFYFDVSDCAPLANAIAQLRPQVDILLIALHWGPNMRERPSPEYIACAHALVDAGVDIIYGQSAHLFQGIEWYKNKLILYDTGDFVDDYQIDEKLRNDQSFLFSITLNKKGVQKLKLIPVIIGDMQVNQAKGADYQEIMNRIQPLSAEFGTTINNDGLLLNMAF